MPFSGLMIDFHPLPAPLPMWRAGVDATQWLDGAQSVADGGGRLVSLWGTDRSDVPSGGFSVSACYAIEQGLYWVDLPLAAGVTTYPNLATIFPCTDRMQRATADLLGIRPAGAEDTRPWLNHAAWSADRFPLRQADDGANTGPVREVQDYPFVRVEGDGVHEIPVGPVHAGIIEPGHFRFSIVGEKVLRLEERLGYTHKGVEKRFTQLAPVAGHRLAGRVSGDSTVAYAWAYCMALESAAACEVPARAHWLRALMLERERVANHLADLGALGNDAGLAFGLAQFSRLREDWLRLSHEAFGHRLMMDCVMPGGVAWDVRDPIAGRMADQADRLEREVKALRAVYDEHAGLQDRFLATGRVRPELASRLGLTGLAGRASGLAADLRCDHPWQPYEGLDVKMATHRNGDVAARVTVRFEETLESLRLIRDILDGIPAGDITAALLLPDAAACGAGWIEGWRGEVLVTLELAGRSDNHRIIRCHCHDPSWQNWPALEHAVIGNIVPDFPLINKSFNLSYSGHDV